MSKGIRIAQAGISVSKAADYQKTMDERWPILEHSFMGIVDVQNKATSSTGVLENAGGTIAHIPIFQHRRGYLPGFRFRHISYSGFNPDGEQISSMVFADSEYIWLGIFKSAGVLTINLKFWLAIIDRDLSKEFTTPVDIVTADQVTNPSPFGLKILNSTPPRGMEENSKAVYTANTNAKAMAIHSHGVRTGDAGNANKLIIAHRLGYPPSYYIAKRAAQEGAVNPSLGKTTVAVMGSASAIASADSVNLTARGAQNALVGDYLFLILKDPVNVAK